MNIYIAARFHRKEEVRRIQTLLKEHGHTISADWTVHKGIKPYIQNMEIAQEYATEDIEGIKNSDVAIFLTNEEVGTGMTTEFGAALATNLLTGKPALYVVGEFWDKNLFYFHPVVKRFGTLEEVLSLLGV